ncbi:MAG: 50S ribosomal protein L29 [Anaerolineales bacterium]|jgi:large subunit ribosomal protein L29|nr:50S ribosomal protein L29 [Anaerolineales bacterium]MCK5314695.1 50S ribosomal protein L29 [Anaerolineales bacterium]MCK5428378.1 50S ribosomal protein L29 [Anaerolineales bacterium]
MKAEEIRALSNDEIRAEVDDAREELMNFRFQMAFGGLPDHTRLSYTRRKIARMLTILNEREYAASQEGEG